MQEIKDQYGNDAFYIQYGTGMLGATVSKSWHPDNTMFARLMNLWGGYLRQYADYSTGQITWEMPLFQRRRLVEQRGHRPGELQEHRAVRQQPPPTRA